MKTIILAGGYATRLWPITEERAKPLLPVAGKPIIDYILDSEALPGTPIISVNRRFAAQFEAWRKKRGQDVELVVEKTWCEREKLGTVGAVAFVIDECGLDEDILVIGGDNIFELDLVEFLRAYRGKIQIALHDLGDPDRVRGRYGVAIVEDRRVVGFQEKPTTPQSTLASTACYIYPRHVLPMFRTFFESAPQGHDAPGYFNQWGLEEHGWDVDGFVFESDWFDVGDRRSYLAATRRYTSAGVWKGENVQMAASKAANSVILGHSTIKNSVIQGCVVDENCQLEGVALQDCLVGKGSVLIGEHRTSGTAGKPSASGHRGGNNG